MSRSRVRRAGARSGGAARIITVWWRDIPAQVLGQGPLGDGTGRERLRRPLPERFQRAIDRAAMRAGKGSSGAYLEEWRRSRESCPPEELEARLELRVATLTAAYPDERLEALVRRAGMEPVADPGDRKGNRKENGGRPGGRTP